MTVALTGAGSWGVRTGHIIGGAMDILAIEGGAATARTLSGASWNTRLTTLDSDYSAGTAIPKTFGLTPQNISNWQTSSSAGFLQQLQQLATNTLTAMVNLDQGLGELSPLSTQAALQYLINQMQGNSTSLQQSVPAAGAQTAGPITPTGNPILVFSVKNGPGQSLAYVLPETIFYTTIADAITGGRPAGQEQMSAVGQAAIGNVYAYNWPGGSGCSVGLTLISGAQNNGSTAPGAGLNWLANGDFTSYAGNANQPDNWDVQTGIVGTNIQNGGSGNAYTTGGGSLEILGDGATLVSVEQQFGTPTSLIQNAGGTPAVLKPDVPYAFNLWLKLSAGSPSTGIMKVELVDGSNNVINDDAAVPNAVTITLTGISDTAFHNYNGVFRLPANPPATVKLRIRESTAIDSGKNIFMGRIGFTQMTQLYAGGPFVAGFSGSTPTIKNDQWTSAITNTWGVFQQWAQRWWNMTGLGLQFPQSNSPTVADTLAA